MVGRYVVCETLGSGAMGVVERAYDRALGREVALKRMTGVGVRRRARLIAEARALAQLSHPNVVAVYDVREQDGEVRVAMECIDGINLAQWLDTPREVDEVIAMFRQAGAGLQAAHEAGIVHRDFKPSNVMVGNDGRVRVVDFGLAAEDAVPVPTTLPDARPSAAMRLTETDAVVGTLVFMAPEQQQGGRAIDARADQYAFAVSLFGALYRTLPFEAHSDDGLLVAKRRQAVIVPRTVRVPARFRRALLRALRAEPARRFADMAALLAELEPASKPRRRWAAGAVVAGLLMFAAGAQRPQARCTDVAARSQRAWNPARAEAIATAFEGTGLPYADATWTAIEPKLHARAEQWTKQATAACVAGEPPPPCVASSIAALEATLDLFESPTATTVERAGRLADAVADPARCDAAIPFDPPPPPTPSNAADVAATTDALVRVRALQIAGHFETANALASEALADALRIGYRPSIAEARLAQGLLEREATNVPAAIETLTAAYFEAQAARHDRVAFAAAEQLATTVGQGDLDDYERWTTVAEAYAEQTPAGSAQRATVLLRKAEWSANRGQTEVAREHLDAALVILEALPNTDLLGPLTLLAQLEHVGGRMDAAEAAARRAVDVAEQGYGPDHPRTAYAAHALGRVLGARGQLQAAQELQSRAAAIYEGAFGTEHAHLASVLSELGALAMWQGDYDQARVHCDRALVIGIAAWGPTHPAVAEFYSLAGAVALESGRYAEAEAHYRHGLEAALGGHPVRAGLFANLSMSLIGQGRYTEAWAARDAALDVLETTGDDPELRGFLLENRGLEAKLQGRYADAAADTLAGISLRERRFGPDHPELVPSLRNLAEILRLAGEEKAAAHYEARAEASAATNR